MTAGAVRIIVETAVVMTILTVKISVNIIKFKTGHGMHEIVNAPVEVTGIAISFDIRYPFAGGMAFATGEVAVIHSESPMVGSMRERKFLFVAVTFVTIVVAMAVDTDSVQFLFGFLR